MFAFPLPHSLPRSPPFSSPNSLVNPFPKPFETKLQAWYPFTLKYFGVYFLKTRTFAYITTVQRSKSGNWHWWNTISKSRNLISISSSVSIMSSIGKENPGSQAEIHCPVSLLFLHLDHYFSLPSVFYDLDFFFEYGLVIL